MGMETGCRAGMQEDGSKKRRLEASKYEKWKIAVSWYLGLGTWSLEISTIPLLRTGGARGGRPATLLLPLVSSRGGHQAILIAWPTT
jgi:hypothetical protein